MILVCIFAVDFTPHCNASSRIIAQKGYFSEPSQKTTMAFEQHTKLIH